MALNPDKSEAILLGTRQRAHSYSSLATVNVASSQIPLADHIKILGVTLDKNLSMSASPFIIISAPYATSVALYLKTWPKWLRVPSLAPVSSDGVAARYVIPFFADDVMFLHFNDRNRRRKMGVQAY